MPITDTDIDTSCGNTIRGLCIAAAEVANSGNPGTPMDIAPADPLCARKW
jgi:transketolase